ncbi:hypothetical protein EAE99_002294 [Botrytis elliptica]|nr:hypothetical protein EAE99_002294 [Botrytis elliptica]
MSPFPGEEVNNVPRWRKVTQGEGRYFAGDFARNLQISDETIFILIPTPFPHPNPRNLHPKSDSRASPAP